MSSIRTRSTSGHSEAPPLVRTIGHGARPLDEFIELLGENSVRRIVDVRTMPRSRHNPQFNRESLPDALSAWGIGYTHMAGLGGLRHPRADSINTAWHNDSFRGFADYMQTSEFRENVEKLLDMAESETIALMCAETVPWRCHRSLIVDALTIRGCRVEHVLGKGKLRAHEITPWARVDGLKITYPGENEVPADTSAHGL